MRPDDRLVSASTASRDCSPWVDTLAAKTTSESDAEALTNSTVTSERKVMAVASGAAGVSVTEANLDHDPGALPCDPAVGVTTS